MTFLIDIGSGHNDIELSSIPKICYCYSVSLRHGILTLLVLDGNVKFYTNEEASYAKFMSISNIFYNITSIIDMTCNPQLNAMLVKQKYILNPTRLFFFSETLLNKQILWKC